MPKNLGRLHRSREDAESELKRLLADASALQEAAEQVSERMQSLNQARRSDPNFQIREALGDDVGISRITRAHDQVVHALWAYWPQVEIFLETTFDDSTAATLIRRIKPDRLIGAISQTRHLVNELQSLSLKLPHYSEAISEGKDAQDAPSTAERSASVGTSSVRIFVSHAAADRILATDLVDLIMACLELKDSEILCTSVPGHRLAVGADAASTIKRELSSTSVVVGLLTPNSLASGWVLFELGAAWGAGKPLMPILANGADFSGLPGPLKESHAVLATEESDIVQVIDELSKQTGANRRSGPKVHAAVKKFAARK